MDIQLVNGRRDGKHVSLGKQKLLILNSRVCYKARPVNSQNALDVFSFRSAPEYLNAVLQSRSRTGQTKSLRGLCQWVGIKSPATLSLILRGKRSISEDVEEKLVAYSKLSGTRKRYLKALTSLTRTRSEEGQLALREELFYLKYLAEARHLEVKQYEFLSRWFYSALFVLVGLPNFNEDPEKLSKRLGRYASAASIQLALDSMLELGLLERIDGKLKQATGTVIKTDDEAHHLSIRRYHRAMIDLASKSLALPPESREVTALTVGLPLSKLPEIKTRIRQFREEIDALLDKHQTEANEVYQLNIQFFPLTFSEGDPK